MMTTGYDCSDLLNIVFMRPVFSPSDFIQMKGRGTRLYTFKYTDYNDGEKLIEVKKENFRIIDFFAVCEYFEEKYDYDAPLAVPRNEKGITIPPQFPGPDGPTLPGPVGVDLGEDDTLQKLNETAVGNEGMRIDREMFRSFQDEVKSNDDFVKLYNAGNIDEALSYLKTEILGEDKPKYYMTPEKIRKIFNLDRRLDLREILDLIMNNKEPLTKAQYIQQKFDEFVSDKNLSEELVGELYNDAFELFDAYITNRRVAEAIDNKDYSLLAGFGSITIDQLKRLGVDRINQIIGYVRDYINVEKLRVKD
jgi:type I restriction enzyme R subunit